MQPMIPRRRREGIETEQQPQRCARDTQRARECCHAVIFSIRAAPLLSGRTAVPRRGPTQKRCARDTQTAKACRHAVIFSTRAAPVL